MDRTIPAGEFKAKCLDLMDEVARTGDSIVITKRGKPVARLGPAARKPRTLRGFYKDKLRITGDVIAPIDVAWNATK